MALQLNLYCPVCLSELAKKGEVGGVETLPPIFSNAHEVINSGIYHTHCEKGHDGIVVLRNLQFELLYELAIHAIADGYYRDAVASATASMERYFEFFIRVAHQIQKVDEDVIEKGWKRMSNMSERQLGAYISLYSVVLKETPQLLNDKQTAFRNRIIHKGEFPSKEESIEFVGVVYNLILNSLHKVIEHYKEDVTIVFEKSLPHYKEKAEENILEINHPTILSVVSLLEDNTCARELESIDEQVHRVIRTRGVQRMRFAKDVNKLIQQDADDAARSVLNENNNRVIENDFQFQINADASAIECVDMLAHDIEEYEGIIDLISEQHPDVNNSDMMTVGLGNLEIHSRVYVLYLRAKIYKLMLDNNPEDIQIKEKYKEAEQQLEEYHKDLSVYD